ncbi:dienelactone hydrolase family protein [Marnyiella aurantia]|uniref:Dienelactone hydrolase family protein n=1 Tax=Marnyiella aurantia TaxID=2758037 RepID=A0A7D7LU96_9FLAO|nr:alpha/beta fold hydrolase [Marnyiella aurantia]MBA5245784.1 dienelactone hydrolase family protein [Marnyiella aurantia]QMS98813.1 dienelactone hydrolase family protein [Marnyiella aurantia]
MKINIQKNVIIKNPQTQDFLADACYPETTDKLPLVIFAHGYKGYKDWGAWDLMAEKIAQAGFYFVKFNFSHNGTTLDNPTEFADLEAFANNNFSKEMLDYEAVIEHFVRKPEINPEKVALVGHSRGAGISVIKAFEDERVKALVSLAGVSHFGYRFPSGDRLTNWQESGVMYSENARTRQQMPHYFQFYEDYKQNEDRFSVQYSAQHLEKPMLIIQGTDDAAVKDKEAYLLNEWCKGSELIILDGANHTFGATEPWTQATLPSDLQTSTDKIIEFLKNKL